MPLERRDLHQPARKPAWTARIVTESPATVLKPQISHLG